MTNYRVVHGRDIPALKATVEIALERGWVLQGGVCFGPSNGLYQAMTWTEDCDERIPDEET